MGQVVEASPAKLKESGLLLHSFGVTRGPDTETVHQSDFPFMQSDDPRIRMLRRFGKATDILLEGLRAENQENPLK